MNTNPKPSIPQGILFSLLGFVIFYLLCEIIGFILVLLYALILVIPIICDLLDLLFIARGDGPDIAIPTLYFSFSYFLTISLLERIVKNVHTLSLTLKLLGIYSIILNIIFLVLNVIGDGAWGVNIGFIISGFVFYFKSYKVA